MMNHYNWGGYFIWKLYPQYRVFMDGRADVYGDALMNQFGATYYLIDDWKKSLQTWGIRTLVLPPDAPADYRPSIRSGMEANLCRFRGGYSDQTTPVHANREPS